MSKLEANSNFNNGEPWASTKVEENKVTYDTVTKGKTETNTPATTKDYWNNGEVASPVTPSYK